MWTNFFENGGWGMYPVSLFGFLLLAAGILYVLRPEARFLRLVIALGVATFGAGLLGTSVGVCNSAHYLPEVPRPDQLQILALGVEESLHNLVLALILVVIASLITSAGALRSKNSSPVLTPRAQAAQE